MNRAANDTVISPMSVGGSEGREVVARGVFHVCACAAVVVLAGGCASNSSAWFGPEWDRIIREQGDTDSLERDLRKLDGVAADPVDRDSLAATAPLPDLHGDGPIEMSVEQAVLLALTNNRELAVAQLTPTITGAFELVERGRFAPEVFADFRYEREDAVETARSTGDQFSVRSDDNTLDAGIRQDLPTGTNVELGLSQDRSSSNRAPEQQRARIGLTVTQSLLRGFGPAVNLAAVRQAELDTVASRYELRGFVESLLADTEVAYWETLLAQRQIEIVQRALDVAKQQADQIDQRIEVGVLARTESAAASSEVARREQALIEAESAFETARLRLFRFVNADLSHTEGRVLALTTPTPIDAEPIDQLDERLQLARRLRADLAEARLRLDQNRLETIRTRNGLLPRLDVFIALGKTGYSDTFAGSFRELDEDTYDFGAGVSFSQALGDTTARGAYLASLGERQQAAAAVANLEQLVELDVRLAATDVERARRQIAASTTTRELQEQTAEAEQQRFEVGSSTSLLVAQAQRDLLEAQLAEVRAIANHRIALIRLYLAEGSLLERRGIDATP